VIHQYEQLMAWLNYKQRELLTLQQVRQTNATLCGD
jgi:hypothetical protein